MVNRCEVNRDEAPTTPWWGLGVAQAWLENKDFDSVPMIPRGVTHLWVFAPFNRETLRHLRVVWNRAGDEGPMWLIWFKRQKGKEGKDEVRALTGFDEDVLLNSQPDQQLFPRADGEGEPLHARLKATVIGCTMSVSAGEYYTK